jgi:hypothetical protein
MPAAQLLNQPVPDQAEVRASPALDEAGSFSMSHVENTRPRSRGG